MKFKFIETEYMPNGEKRGRKDHGWQNAHYHKYAVETYLVIKGKILVAIKNGNMIKFKQLKPGRRITIPPRVKHNIHVGKNTLFYVSKKSKEDLEDDWYSANKLDTYSKDIKRLF